MIQRNLTIDLVFVWNLFKLISYMPIHHSDLPSALVRVIYLEKRDLQKQKLHSEIYLGKTSPNVNLLRRMNENHIC